MIARSLHGRLALLLVALLVGLGLVLLAGILEGSRLFSEEVHFQLDNKVAEHVAKHREPFQEDGSVATKELTTLFMHAMDLNPSLEIYLLDTEGSVLAYDAPDELIVRRAVDLEPIRAFAAGHGGRTIRGDDPRSLDGKKPISVHPVANGDEPGGYLYIILGGQNYDSIFAGLRTSYILRYAALFVGGALLVASILGLFALGRLTRPLRDLRRRVDEFSREGADPALEADDQGEIEGLERTFDAMARRLEDQLAELRDNDARRREFVASISHDLRTPTSAVQGYLETLIERRDRIDEGERAQFLETAMRQCRRLTDLVDQLFELARLEAKEGMPAKETFALSELVQDIVCEFQGAADAKNITLAARFPYDLPPVHADIGLIQRALDNLIDNAIRYTPPGGGIDVVLAHQPGGVEVRVHDAGPGIPADELPKLFDRFYRVEQAGREPGTGAGLGLAITRRIIDLHDSTIQVASDPEEGTTFSFVLATGTDSGK